MRKSRFEEVAHAERIAEFVVVRVKFAFAVSRAVPV